MDYNKMVDGEPLTKEKFLTPSPEWGIVPFWFWNGELSYDEIEYQLKELKDKGCPGLYIHARFGVREELGYMNDAWLDRAKFTLEKARELGLQTWIYDEYNWPSGTCGQTIMKDHPELTNVYLEAIVCDIPGQYFMFLEGTDSRYNDMEQSEPVYACAIKNADMESGNYEIVELMPSLSFDKVITWEAPKGPWKLIYFIERKSSWYSDVLNPETTKYFLDYTHQKYKDYFGADDFKDVKGFFTDEPAMHYFETGRNNFIIPWSKQMVKIFREKNGYDIKRNLPKLFFDCGGDTEQVRYDFWNTLTDQYNSAYFGQIHDWCKANHTVSTGHLLYEESLRMHTRVDGNLFRHLEQFDMTGVDHLYPRIGTRDMENEHVALKIASSAAHQNGSTRLVCESMGGSYWDCTMERQKWIADWEYMLGVNQFIPHGFHYSVEGERKRDWPPSMFYQFTWWEQYGQFNDYMKRMAYALAGGERFSQAAILYPINSIRANYVPEEEDKISAAIDADFATMTDRLLRLHYTFDYLDEDVLNDRCTLQNGKICIKGEQYSMLILPPCTHIKARTLETIEKFVADGGKVSGNALLPYKTIEGEAENLNERVKRLFGVDPAELRTHFLNCTDPTQTLTVRKVGRGTVAFVSGLGFKAAVRKDEKTGIEMLSRMMRSCIDPEIEIDNDEVFFTHHVKDGTDIFFLTNPVADPADITIRWPGEHSIEVWNLENGEIAPAPVYSFRNGRTELKTHLEPYGSALFAYAAEKANARVETSDANVESVSFNKEGTHGMVHAYGRLKENGGMTLNLAGEEKILTISAGECLPEIELDGVFTFETNKPNSINTDSWKMTYAMPDDDIKAITEGRADMTGWFTMKMGAWELQLPEERENGTYPVDLWYVTSIEAETVPDDLRIMIDGFKGSSWKLYVNGIQITVEPVRSYLDAEMKEVPVSAEFRQGTNIIAVRLTVTKKSDGMIDLLKVIGTFAVENKNGKDTIVPMVRTMTLGDWVTKKLPYYSGTGFYTKKINLSAAQISKKLMLQAEIGKDVLLIEVNGKPVKNCLWKPYAADISDYVAEGENEIRLGVVNTLMNLLESSHTPSGLMSAKIIPFDRYTLDV